VRDVAVSGSTQVFSVPDEQVRRIVDALDDGGWRILTIEPKRASLEDYFAALLADPVSDDAESRDVSKSGDHR
jgi:hypothetical protein